MTKDEPPGLPKKQDTVTMTDMQSPLPCSRFFENHEVHEWYMLQICIKGKDLGELMAILIFRDLRSQSISETGLRSNLEKTDPS